MSNSSKNRPSGKRAAHRQAFPWLWVGAAALILLVIVGVVYGLGQRSGPTAAPALDGRDITVSQAYDLYGRDVLFLDVRTPEEWAQGVIPDSKLITLDELTSRASELPHDQDIVVVCRSGRRSAEAVQQLQAVGFTQLASMAGGVNAWGVAGYPLVQP